MMQTNRPERPDTQAELTSLSWPLFESSFPSTTLEVAEILGVRDGALEWTPKTVATRTPAEIQKVLYDFIKLENAKEEQIEKFARRWGPLGLCGKHDAPMSHRHHGPEEDREEDPELQIVPGLSGRNLARNQRICAPRLARPGVYSEPIAGWWHYSKLAVSLIRAASLTARGEPVDPTD